MKHILFVGILMSLGMPSYGQTKQDTASSQSFVKTPATQSPNKIKLEATIRASKEQPKVLTIVPWQLPLYSKVKGQAPEVIKPPQLRPLFRKSFVNEQKVFKRMTVN